MWTAAENLSLQLSKSEAEHSEDQARIEQLRAQVAELEQAVGQAIQELEVQSSAQAEKEAIIDELSNIIASKDAELQASLSAQAAGTSQSPPPTDNSKNQVARLIPA